MGWAEAFQWAFTGVGGVLLLWGLVRGVHILYYWYPELFWALVSMPVIAAILKYCN